MVERGHFNKPLGQSTALWRGTWRSLRAINRCVHFDDAVCFIAVAKCKKLCPNYSALDVRCGLYSLASDDDFSLRFAFLLKII